MKKSRHSEEQIIGYLKQVEVGIPLKDMCRKVGVSREYQASVDAV